MKSSSIFVLNGHVSARTSTESFCAHHPIQLMQDINNNIKLFAEFIRHRPRPCNSSEPVDLPGEFFLAGSCGCIFEMFLSMKTIGRREK